MTSSILSSPSLAFCSDLPLAILDARTIITFYLPLAGLIFALIITLFGMWMAVQDKRLKHETIRLAIEKGQPLPAGLLDEDFGAPHGSPAARPRERSRLRAMNDLRGGLVCLAIAGGLYFIVPFVAPIMAFIGLALLICWFVEYRAAHDDVNKS